VQFVTGLHLAVQADDLVKFADPRYRSIISQCVVARGGQLTDIMIRPEEGAVYLILAFSQGVTADLPGLASDLVQWLGLRDAQWRQFTPVPPPAAAAPKFSGVKGKGTQCPVCFWVDGSHDPHCPNRPR
jgi:hypothetical protein